MSEWISPLEHFEKVLWFSVRFMTLNKNKYVLLIIKLNETFQLETTLYMFWQLKISALDAHQQSDYMKWNTKLMRTYLRAFWGNVHQTEKWFFHDNIVLDFHPRSHKLYLLSKHLFSPRHENVPWTFVSRHANWGESRRNSRLQNYSLVMSLRRTFLKVVVCVLF